MSFGKKIRSHLSEFVWTYGMPFTLTVAGLLVAWIALQIGRISP